MFLCQNRLKLSRKANDCKPLPGAPALGDTSATGGPSICRRASNTPTPAATPRFRLRTCASLIGMRLMPPDAAHTSCTSSGSPVVSAPNSSQSPGAYTRLR